MKKVYRYNELVKLHNRLAGFQRVGMSIVLTGGHFQVIHSGHINLLKESAKKGDILVVAINSDESSIHKNGHCFLSFEHRATIVSELPYVDLVIENPHNHMEEMIYMISPDFYTKGGDVNSNNLHTLEKNACEEYDVEILFGVGGCKTASSSDFLDKYYQWRKISEACKNSMLLVKSNEYRDIEINEFIFDIPESFYTGLSPCCNVKVKDGQGCHMCKTCPECGKFLGCWNLAGRLYRDKSGKVCRG